LHTGCAGDATGAPASDKPAFSIYIAPPEHPGDDGLCYLSLDFDRIKEIAGDDWQDLAAEIVRSFSGGQS
jgi:hypothetical protein